MLHNVHADVHVMKQLIQLINIGPTFNLICNIQVHCNNKINIGGSEQRKITLQNNGKL